ncbi:MAG: MBG domain-containing protein, partial [Burkholderiales bacterium]
KNVLGLNGSTLNVDAGYVVNDGNGGGNYSVTLNSALGTITPAPLGVTLVGPVTKTYDGTTSAVLAPPNFTLSGLVGGESASVTQTVGVYATPNAGAGINVSTTLAGGDFSAGGGTLLSNYVLPTGPLNANVGTINPAALSIRADDKTRAVGNPNPPLTATYSGFVNGETPVVLGGVLVITTPATIASPAGAYPIIPSGQTSTNYTITYVNGVMTVTSPASVNLYNLLFTQYASVPRSPNGTVASTLCTGSAGVSIPPAPGIAAGMSGAADCDESGAEGAGTARAPAGPQRDAGRRPVPLSLAPERGRQDDEQGE